MSEPDSDVETLDDFPDVKPETRLGKIGPAVVGLSFLGCGGYALVVHGRSTPMQLAIVLFALGAICLLVLSLVERLVKVPRWIEIAALTPALLSFFGACFGGAFLLLERLVLATLGSQPGLLALGVFVAGLAAYGFRQYASALYGLSELALGVLIGTQRLLPANLSAPLTSQIDVALATVTAGVYLVVRGCDNIDKGLRDPKRQDQVLLRLRAWLTKELPPTKEDLEYMRAVAQIKALRKRRADDQRELRRLTDKIDSSDAK